MATWAEALTSFEANLDGTGLSPGTVAGYVGDLHSFSSWLVASGDHRRGPDEFTSDDLNGYTEHLLQTRGLSPATINRRLQSVRKFCRFAVQSGIRDTNPAVGAPLLQHPIGWGLRILAPSEVARLDEAAMARRSPTALRDRAIVQLLLQTGMRASELAALRLCDLELEADDASLKVRGAGGRPSRRLGLNNNARDALLAYLGQARAREAVHVFLSRDGRPLSVRTVQQIVAGLGKAAGIPVSPRMVRDTYASTVWQETGSLAAVAERMGYRRPETAIRHIMPLQAPGPSAEVLGERSALSLG